MKYCWQVSLSGELISRYEVVRETACFWFVKAYGRIDRTAIHKNDFSTEEAAIRRANQILGDRRESLRIELAKLHGLTPRISIMPAEGYDGPLILD